MLALRSGGTLTTVHRESTDGSHHKPYSLFGDKALSGHTMDVANLTIEKVESKLS